jgi:hypothetical protein
VIDNNPLAVLIDKHVDYAGGEAKTCAPQKHLARARAPAWFSGILRRRHRRQRVSYIMRAALSWLRILGDLLHFLCLGLRSRTSLAAENLFLRKQLAFYRERRSSPDVWTIPLA